MQKENKLCFDSLEESTKTKLLQNIGIQDFNINDENFIKFDKYFTNFRPQFMKYEQMYKDLDKANFTIKDIHNYTLKDIVYCFYNESSQVAHGCFLDWNKNDIFNQKEAENLEMLIYGRVLKH